MAEQEVENKKKRDKGEGIVIASLPCLVPLVGSSRTPRQRIAACCDAGNLLKDKNIFIRC